jgi:hypothetical protein
LQGGQYILTLVDFYGANFSVFVLGTIEIIGVAWVYGTLIYIQLNTLTANVMLVNYFSYGTIIESMHSLFNRLLFWFIKRIHQKYFPLQAVLYQNGNFSQAILVTVEKEYEMEL